jgi:hypothetical protein
MTSVLLAIAYALLAALLLNIWISSEWRTSFKLALIAIVGLFYVGTYIGIRDIKGWATEEQVPRSFRLVWAKTEEPDKRTGTQGQIYLWVQALSDSGIIESEPRAYKLPYSIKLAEEVQGALNETKKGVEVDGATAQEVDGIKSDEQQATSDRRKNLSYVEEKGIILEFKNRPRGKLPSKGI